MVRIRRSFRSDFWSNVGATTPCLASRTSATMLDLPFGRLYEAQGHLIGDVGEAPERQKRGAMLGMGWYTAGRSTVYDRVELRMASIVDSSSHPSTERRTREHSEGRADAATTQRASQQGLSQWHLSVDLDADSWTSIYRFKSTLSLSSADSTPRSVRNRTSTAQFPDTPSAIDAPLTPFVTIHTRRVFHNNHYIMTRPHAPAVPDHISVRIPGRIPTVLLHVRKKPMHKSRGLCRRWQTDGRGITYFKATQRENQKRKLKHHHHQRPTS